MFLTLGKISSLRLNQAGGMGLGVNVCALGVKDFATFKCKNDGSKHLSSYCRNSLLLGIFDYGTFP